MHRFASALGGHLAPSQGWSQSTTDLVPDAGEAILFATDTAAVLLVAGDGVKPGQFRTLMEQLVKKAKAPTSPRQPAAPIPWNALIVLLVFEQECSSDMRAFVGNERRPLGGPKFIQGGWVDLSSGEAEFRTNKTQFENDVLTAVKQAAADHSAPPARGGGSRASGRLRDDFGGGFGDQPDIRPKKKGSVAPLILGLLLIGGGGGGYWYMYGNPMAPPPPAVSPAPAAPASKAPDGKPSAKPDGDASATTSPATAPSASARPRPR